MATNPRQTEKESHEAAHDVTRKAGEQTAQASRSMTDTGERFASAGIEAGRRNAQGLTSTWRSGSEAASRIAERSMDQLSTMFGMTGDSARQALNSLIGQSASGYGEHDDHRRWIPARFRRVDSIRTGQHRAEPESSRALPRLPKPSGVDGASNPNRSG